jgi:hypothetical protein
MSQTSDPATPTPAQIPTRFLLRFGILCQELPEPLNADFEPSKSTALKLFLRLVRVHDEDEAKLILHQNPKGTLTLLYAIIGESNRQGVPLSLRDIAAAKREDTEWGKKGFEENTVWWFFRKAIENLP